MYFEILENGKVLENRSRRIRLSELEFGAQKFKEMFRDRDIDKLETNDSYKEIFKSVLNSEYSTMTERLEYLAHKRQKFNLEDKERQARIENGRAKSNSNINEEKVGHSLEFLQKMDEYLLIKNNEEKMKESGIVSFFKETFGKAKPVPEEVQDLFKKEDGTPLTEEELELKKEALLEEAVGQFKNSEYNILNEEEPKQSTLEWTYHDKIDQVKNITRRRGVNNDSALNITNEMKLEYKGYVEDVKEYGAKRVEETNKELEEIRKKIGELEFPAELENKIDNEIKLAFMAEIDYHFRMYDQPQRYDSSFTEIYRATIHKELEENRLEMPNSLEQNNKIEEGLEMPNGLENNNGLENVLEMPKGKNQMQPDVPSVHIRPKPLKPN